MERTVSMLHSKNENATLLGIIKRWNPPKVGHGSDDKNHNIVISLLPDFINKELLDQGKIDRSCFLEIEGKVETRLVSGNWRYEHDTVYYFNAAVTRELLYKITDNEPIRYIGCDNVVPCQKNMLSKLYSLVLESDIDKVKKLFEDIELHPFPADQLYFHSVFLSALKKLYQTGTPGSLTYGIFLLILHSIFHRDMDKLSPLYLAERIQKVVVATEPRVEGERTALPQNHSLLIDHLYSHKYYAYVFRDDYDKLYEDGHFTLCCDTGIPSATLELIDTHAIDPATNKTDPVAQRFVGIPILSGQDSMIYSVMHDENNDNALGILCIQYTHFTNGENCYFRSGLFVTSDYKKVPEVRKIVITERQLEDDEKAIAMGILKMTGRQIILSKKQMAKFCKEYGKDKRCSWINEFRESIPRYLNNWYCFDERAVLSFSDPRMSEKERLGMMLKLKSFSQGASEPLNRIHCKDDPNLHKIMR